MGHDPEILVDLTTARTDFEAETIAEALRSQGIPAQAFTTAGAALQWDVAVSQPMRVQVRRGDLVRASAALKAIRAESVDIDWSEVETGDRTPVTESERREAADMERVDCAACGREVTSARRSGPCPNCGRPLDVVGVGPHLTRSTRWANRVGVALIIAFALFVIVIVLTGLR